MRRPVPHSRPFIAEGERRAVERVLASAMLVDGTLRRSFAESLRELSPSITHCSLFPSGRVGLCAALQCLDLQAGSGIIVQTYVCDAVLWAIREAGHKIVLCDVGDNWVSNSSQMEQVVSQGAAAIILAPPFGFNPSVDDFRHFGLPIIQDLCQASPLALSGSDRADLGDMAVLSFHPTKYMCAVSGGAVLDLTGRHQHGLARLSGDHHATAPFSELQAAIGLEQLARLPCYRNKRAAIAQRYLTQIPERYTAWLTEIGVVPGDMFRLPLYLPDRDVEQLLEQFNREGVMARRGVDQLAHRLLELPDVFFPNAVQMFNKTLSLPFHPSLTKEEIEVVTNTAGRLLR